MSDDQTHAPGQAIEGLEAEAMGSLIAAFDLADRHGLDIDDLIDRVRQGR
ncbi:hypothetical protein [Miltoncostaea oceani]|nr:hypothetical protein [Miltoncostaea oceani]